MIGVRSWTAEVTAFGVVVRIEHVFTQLPLGFFQRSQVPAASALILPSYIKWRLAFTPSLLGTSS
jgi:hypothetical protein